MAVLKGQPTDRVPYQEIFFGHRAFAEHFGGPQDSPEAAARYLRNSGQCSYLVGGFWWIPEDTYRVTGEGQRRYAAGRLWTLGDVAAMREPDLAAAAKGLDAAIADARAQELACHVFIMSSFHYLANRTPAEIGDMTRRMLAAGAPGGRYAAACNTLPGNDIPLANMLAYRDAVVDYGAPCGG